MTGKLSTRPPKPRRIARLAAALVLAAALSGCVVYPYPGPGYHDHYYYR